MNRPRTRLIFPAVAVLLLLANIALLAQESQSEAVTSEVRVTETARDEKEKIKQEQIRGVEISVVNSTVQDGVESPTQVNLEKVLKLLSKPKPKPKSSPAAAAGLGGRKSKPKPGGGGGDSRKVVNSSRQPLEGGS